MNNLYTKNRQTIEDQRIESFREKQITDNISLKLEQAYDPDKKQIFLRYAEHKDASSNNHTHIGAVLCAAFGTASAEYVNLIFSQTVNVPPL